MSKKEKESIWESSFEGIQRRRGIFFSSITLDRKHFSSTGRSLTRLQFNLIYPSSLYIFDELQICIKILFFFKVVLF